MSTKQRRIPAGSADIDRGGTPEMTPETEARNPRQDFAFAVKLFGACGLVVFLIWLMNRAVT